MTDDNERKEIDQITTSVVVASANILIRLAGLSAVALGAIALLNLDKLSDAAANPDLMTLYVYLLTHSASGFLLAVIVAGVGYLIKFAAEAPDKVPVQKWKVWVSGGLAALPIFGLACYLAIGWGYIAAVISEGHTLREVFVCSAHKEKVLIHGSHVIPEMCVSSDMEKKG